MTAYPSADPTRPLRLVDAGGPPASSERPGEALRGVADPRWVLAVRTAEQLEGALLTPEKRQRLIRLGRTMGLNPFDCNLVIAIVQDQARRGHKPEYCPTAGENQLRMVPLPRHAGWLAQIRRRPRAAIGLLVLGLLVLEVGLALWLL